MAESNQYFPPDPPTEEVKNFDKETGSAQCHKAELWLAVLAGASGKWNRESTETSAPVSINPLSFLPLICWIQ
jgi:hypothetical protein